MSLLTRCPRCRTLFRVLPAQLQARAGQVRCGRCMHVFDGFHALAVEQANAVAEPVRFEPESAHAVREVTSTEAVPSTSVPEVTSTEAVASTPIEEAPVQAVAREAVLPAAEPPPPVEPPAVPRTPRSTRLREYWSSQVGAPIKERLARKTSVRTKWAAACTLLAIVLGMQMSYVFRSDIAARYPGSRPALSAFCDVAGCVVALPQRPHLVRIEASDVHMIDASRPSLIQVTATLRSYANYDLAYPALDLVLTNANEHALARRVFVPEEYLDPTRDSKVGIPPRGEVTVALDLDTGDLNAAGFRLDLLAAPAP